MVSPLFRFVERLRRRRRPEVRISRGYEAWVAQEDRSGGAAEGPLISVILPVYDTDAGFLAAAIRSVIDQRFAHWELCIADDASPAPHVARVLAEFAVQDARIKTCRLTENCGIAQATNAALALARGAYVALLDHDDVLAPQALAEIAGLLGAYPETSVVFSDEDQLVAGRRCRPYFKPGWNPDLMLSQNLVSHLGVYRKALIDRIGGMRPGFDGSQDYDLALRATAAMPDSDIRHIPKVLYHWRQHEDSFSARRLAVCQQAARAALEDCVGGGARVEANPDIPQWTRIVYDVPDPEPLVSLILPGGIAPIDPGYCDVEQVAEAAQARGEILLFLSPGLECSCPGWLRELVSQACRPEIGCAGPRIDGRDGRICDSGLLLDAQDIAQSLAPGSDRDDPGYLGHFLLARNVSALSGCCLALRRTVFDAAGGLNPDAGAWWHVDLCLRVAAIGLRCIWTPHARLRYRSRVTAPNDPAGARYMRARWAENLARDPYKNPNLLIHQGNLALTTPSVSA